MKGRILSVLQKERAETVKMGGMGGFIAAGAAYNKISFRPLGFWDKNKGDKVNLQRLSKMGKKKP